MNTSYLDKAREYELNIIGSLLLENQTYFQHEEKINPQHFLHENLRLFLVSIIEKINKNEMVDLVTVAETGDLKKYNVRVDELNVMTTSHVPFYCDQLKKLYICRELMRLGMKLQQTTFQELEEVQEKIAQYQNELLQLGEETLPNNERTKEIQEIGIEVLRDIDDTSPDRSLKTGLHDLDKMTKGFKPGELIIIGGRPSMGKTALSVSILNNLAEEGKKVLYMSFEMTMKQIVRRLIANLANVDSSRINEKNEKGHTVLTSEELKKISGAMSLIDQYSVTVHDQTCKVSEIRAIARARQKKKGLDCIIIDHLGEVTPDDRRLPQREQISQVVQDLKQLAKDLDIPIILLAQLNRAVEGQNDKRPRMADLRESGRIEEVADTILLLYRDDYYDEESEKQNILEIDVAKNREGSTGRVETVFLKKYSKVLSYSNIAQG
jgi:replicative DNA helicase